VRKLTEYDKWATVGPFESIAHSLKEIEDYDGAFGTDDCGWRPEIAKLLSALREMIDFIKWLRAKGVVLSSPTSMSSECLENVRKILNETNK
jgi:hypothetical protein